MTFQRGIVEHNGGEPRACVLGPSPRGWRVSMPRHPPGTCRRVRCRDAKHAREFTSRVAAVSPAIRSAAPGARATSSEAFLTDLHDLWKEHGKAVILSAPN